ncbi:DUF262 domain-containing protein [Clostridium perfringens]
MQDTLKEKLKMLQQTAKERTVKTQSIEYDLETLVKKIKKGFIKLNPDYQRNHRWKESTSSKLIESLILNIPIPVIYLSEDVDVDDDVDDDIARYSVIDGQQRLTAITDYMSNKFALTDLDVLSDLNGSFYNDLPPFLIRRLEERTIKCLRIDSTVDSQVKYDIFERLNSGAVELTAQELRNAIYRGNFNNLIKELAKDSNFRKLLNISGDLENNTKVKKMEDIELVLRFFALDNENYNNLKKGFKKFLSSEMEKFNKYNTEQLKEMEKRFRKTMKIICDSLGELAFAKYKYEKGKYIKMSNFNAAVYDAIAISVSSELVAKNKKIDQKKVDELKKLFSNKKFFDAVSGSVNDKEKVKTRIKLVTEVLS